MAHLRTDQLDVSWAETLARVRGFVAARVGDPDLAADITHDVVVRSIASGALARVDNLLAPGITNVNWLIGLTRKGSRSRSR